tara:strand:+ start:470 stop:850 length:381 start_codon:yes stop_codon:yes gene_type:complete
LGELGDGATDSKGDFSVHVGKPTHKQCGVEDCVHLLRNKVFGSTNKRPERAGDVFRKINNVDGEISYVDGLTGYVGGFIGCVGDLCSNADAHVIEFPEDIVSFAITILALQIHTHPHSFFTCLVST